MFISSTLNLIADNAGLTRYSMEAKSEWSWVTRYSYGQQHLIVEFTQGQHGEEIYSARFIEVRIDEGGHFRPSWKDQSFGDAWQARPFANLGWVMTMLQDLVEQKSRDEQREAHAATLSARAKARKRAERRRTRAFYRQHGIAA